jgi:hypothetical protein
MLSNWWARPEKSIEYAVGALSVPIRMHEKQMIGFTLETSPE